MNQTGHRSVQMARRYIRDGCLFRENSSRSETDALDDFITTENYRQAQ